MVANFYYFLVLIHPNIIPQMDRYLCDINTAKKVHKNKICLYFTLKNIDVPIFIIY